jgi:GNAT superfamily N-acetyltransferase
VSVRVVASAPEHAAALVALFERTGSPCYCRFWHFTGTNNDWLDRCANAKGENQRELEEALASRGDEAKGVVAIDDAITDSDQAIVGWMKVAPVAVAKKIYDRRLYKNLPCFEGDREGVFALGCALIDPSHRKRGLTRELVAGAVSVAKTWGARALEAMPRVPSEPVSDDELWTGPISAFTANGFTVVHEFAPYPVLRKTL